MTLDHSHCQCPSLFGLAKPILLACARRADQTAPCFAIFMESTERPKNPCKDQDHSKNQGYLLQPRPDQMSSTCSDPAYPMNAPAFIRHGSLRPASRDLSGDARSGNANRTAPRSRQASNMSRSFPTGLPISSEPSFHPRPARLAMDLKRVRART
jgi:hypothetical protein